MQSKNRIFPFDWIVFSILFSTSSLILIGRKVGNLGFYSLLFVAVVCILFRANHHLPEFVGFVRKFWKFHLAMAGMFLAILANQLISQDFAVRSFDYPSRMALFFLVAWVCLLCGEKMFRWLQWSYVLGAILSTVKMYIITDGGTTRAQYVDFMPIIEFADMALLLGCFSILSIKYQSGSALAQRIGIAAKILAGVGTLYAAYLSDTRGAWLAIPFLCAIVAIVLFDHIELKKKLIITLLGVAVLTGLFLLSPRVQNRIHSAEQDINVYAKDSASDTSVGTRFGLWKTSMMLFAEHPMIGIGRENFRPTLQRLGQEGKISPVIARQIHSHNETFYNMATLGSFGLIGLMALYIVPLLFFARKLRHEDSELRATAGMGLTLSVGYMIFGLTDVMFMWGACDNFYALFMAIMFSHLHQRERLLALSKAAA
ncbi:O-antigen ligase [Noviherbaspirillum humi]|uniref:O-antigen ligase n=1 Tax=Noviherbaspirillum humi TaxID=1688639 RepID=A0A239EAY9_9BURK|nr:O-antigen ligase family protein [Noviherbaspirillum humi]SNS41641.1 O-antigen ligase [Noviherbaspirillum humi]